MSNRLIHIDQAKAIGIMLIIASHVCVSSQFATTSLPYRYWVSVLNSFYVPLFFMLSGVFESNSPELRILNKRIKRLVRWICVFLIFGLISSGVCKRDWTIQSALQSTVIWFLFTLFWITILFGAIKRIKYKRVVLIALTMIGVSLANNDSVFYISQALICLPFYAIGFFLKQHIINSKFNNRNFVISFIIWILFMTVSYKGPQNISINIITQNFVSFYIIAISGSLVLIEFCKLFTNYWLTFYGRNSIVPMLVQMPFIWLLAKFSIVNDIMTYFLFAIIAGVLGGVCIPLFRNKYYDIFK